MAGPARQESESPFSANNLARRFARFVLNPPQSGGSLTRRGFLNLAGAVVGAALLAACDPHQNAPPIPATSATEIPLDPTPEEIAEIPEPQAILKVKVDKFKESPNPTIMIPAENMTDIWDIYRLFGDMMDTRSYRGIIKQQWNEIVDKTHTSGGEILWIDRDNKVVNLALDNDFSVFAINFSFSSVDFLVEYSRNSDGKIIPAILMIPYKDFTPEMLNTAEAEGSNILQEIISVLVQNKGNKNFHGKGLIVHPDLRNRLISVEGFNQDNKNIVGVFMKMWEELAKENNLEYNSQEFEQFANNYIQDVNLTPGHSLEVEEPIIYKYIETKKLLNGSLFYDRIHNIGYMLVTGTPVNIYRFSLGPDYRIYALVEPIGVEKNLSDRASFINKTMEKTGYMQGGKLVWVPIEHLAVPSRNFIGEY